MVELEHLYIVLLARQLSRGGFSKQGQPLVSRVRLSSLPILVREVTLDRFCFFLIGFLLLPAYLREGQRHQNLI